jgi:hypothetical protein
MFVPCIPNERWYVMTFPKFTNEASCAGSATPDDWFPEFSPAGDPRGRVGIRYRYSYTPEAMRARNICLSCPAYDECLEYSLQWIDLDGIWANKDKYERAEEQRLLGIKPTSLTFTYDNPLGIDIQPRTPIESEWDNV